MKTSALHLYTCLSAFMTLRKGQVINFFILEEMPLERQEKVKNIK